MDLKNRPVAPVIEKTAYESNDCHYGESSKRRVSSTPIQKIISVIFGIMFLEYGIVDTSNDAQLEIIRHNTLYSNAKSDYAKFTYTNISGKCYFVAFTFTSTTYLQGSYEATEATTRSTAINKKSQSWKLQLQIHADSRTYVNAFTHLLQNTIIQIILLIIRLYYKRSKIPKNASRIFLHPLPNTVFLFLGTLEIIFVY